MQCLPGMAERCTAHHGQRHHPGCARHPGMQPRTDRQAIAPGRSREQKADGNESVADVKDQQQPLTHRAIARPAREAHDMQQTGKQKEQSRHRISGARDPQQQCRRGQHKHHPVEPSERHWQASGILPHQPVARKTGNDATTDQADQQHHDSDTDANADVSHHDVTRFQMKRDIADQQATDNARHRQITPVLAGRDLARSGDHDQQKKAHIHQHGGKPSGMCREGDDDAPSDPHQHQPEQRQATDRQTPGPVRNGGEQEARHHRRQEAIQHFVNMPVARHEARGDRQPAVESRHPHQDRQPGI